MNTSWVAETKRRVHELQDALIAAAVWADEAGATGEQREALLGPYRDMLESVQQRDVHLARLVDESDLLIHVRGPAASAVAPRVGMVANLMTQARDEVTRLAKKLAGVTSIRVPAALDMGFVGVAPGSLYLGFAIDPSEDGEASREAVRALASVGRLVAASARVTDVAKQIDDPAARDMAVAAIRRLSPSGNSGIREVDILGRDITEPIGLTTDTRRHARGLMSEPALGERASRVEFIGTVRETDLDANRFEIRNVEGAEEDVRCAHELLEAEVKALLDKRVRVVGRPEFSKAGKVRLLWVDEVELLL